MIRSRGKETCSQAAREKIRKKGRLRIEHPQSSIELQKRRVRTGPPLLFGPKLDAFLSPGFCRLRRLPRARNGRVPPRRRVPSNRIFSIKAEAYTCRRLRFTDSLPHCCRLSFPTSISTALSRACTRCAVSPGDLINAIAASLLDAIVTHMNCPTRKVLTSLFCSAVMLNESERSNSRGRSPCVMSLRAVPRPR